MDNNLLVAFKMLHISKKELKDRLGGNLATLVAIDPVSISVEDVIYVLNAYKEEKIELSELLDWVNTIWFTDLFDYVDDQSDSIASVMDILEELDEDEKTLTKSDVDKYIGALLRNEEVKR